MIYLDQGEVVYITETVFNEETGLPSRQWIKRDGLLHSPPNGEPSLISWDQQGRITHKHWHAYGQKHRIDGPASIIFYPENSEPMTESFLVDGQPLPKDKGPFRIRRHPNGDIWQEEYTNKDGSLPKYSPPLPKP